MDLLNIKSAIIVSNKYICSVYKKGNFVNVHMIFPFEMFFFQPQWMHIMS